jgi:hypothetical protein
MAPRAWPERCAVGGEAALPSLGIIVWERVISRDVSLERLSGALLPAREHIHSLAFILDVSRIRPQLQERWAGPRTAGPSGGGPPYIRLSILDVFGVVVSWRVRVRRVASS